MMDVKGVIAVILKHPWANKPKLNEDLLRSYVTALEDVPPQLLLAAVESLKADTKWFPTVEDVRARVVLLQWEVYGLPGWLEAWKDVWDIIEILRGLPPKYRKQPDFRFYRSPVLKTVVDGLGWQRFMEGSRSDGYLQHAFKQLYEEYMGKLKWYYQQPPKVRLALLAMNAPVVQMAAMLESDLSRRSQGLLADGTGNEFEKDET